MNSLLKVKEVSAQSAALKYTEHFVTYRFRLPLLHSCSGKLKPTGVVSLLLTIHVFDPVNSMLYNETEFTRTFRLAHMACGVFDTAVLVSEFFKPSPRRSRCDLVYVPVGTVGRHNFKSHGILSHTHIFAVGHGFRKNRVLAILLSILV